jgi:hypothetical protein
MVKAIERVIKIEVEWALQILKNKDKYKTIKKLKM